ncbi:MAG: glycosyltransferase [Rhodobacter sp.]|nr:glycosyltransferase [Rhodobacter sp.]
MDRNFLGPALLAASQIVRLVRRRDFDLFIASLTPLDIPLALKEAGVRNLVIDVGDEMRDLDLKIAHLSHAAYLRIWLPGILANRYERILYLDADIFCAGGDISRLLDIQIGSHAVAAVLDKAQWLTPDEPVLEFERYGIPVHRYLNSGALLLDVARYNEQKIFDLFVARQRKGVESQFHDQGILNLVLRGNFAQLSPVWNWQWTHRYPVFTKLARPFLLHLSGLPKPWQAHEQKTRFPRAIIDAYQRSLDQPDEPLAFETDHSGGVREPFVDQINNLGGHLHVWSRYRRQMRQFPDPYRALY